MARTKPNVRSQARANFVKEEDLARQRMALFHQPLSLGEKNTKTGEVKNRVIEARAFGPAMRGEEIVKKGKKRKFPYFG